MSQLIRSGQGLDVSIPAGQSLKISSITGAYSASIVAGAGVGVLAANSSAGATYGPYAGGVVIRISCSADGTADYAVGNPPVLDYKPVAHIAIDPSTGDGTSVLDPAGNSVSGSLVTQPVKTANYTLVASDSGTLIPVTGAVTITLNASSDLTAPVEIRRYDAATLSITRTGTTAIDPSTGSAWGTLSVANKLSSIIIFPGSNADEYGAVKVGA